MKKFIHIFIITTIALFINACSSSDAKKNVTKAVDASFSAFVSSYTSGVISVESPIMIHLTQISEVEPGAEIDKKLFSFSPSLTGKAFWVDGQTIEFRPEQPMQSGTKYNTTFYLSKITEVPDELEEMEYQFQTITQNFEVNVDGLKPYNENDPKKQKLTGTLNTADIANDTDIEKLLTASQNGQNLTITWQHQSEDKSHTFTVENVSRTEDKSNVSLSWNGDALNINNPGASEIDVPALGDFKLMETKIVQSPDQYVILQFSDALKKTQNLNGLISIKGVRKLKFLIEGNVVKVFPNVRQTGAHTVTINPGIRNNLGYKLRETSSVRVAFEQVKPSVRLVGKGTILPSTDGLVLPFEAVSLNAVKVKIIKVYEKKINQFLQVNSFDGNNQIRRVGRPEIYKVIRLDNSGVTNLGKWNRFNLDLSELINAEAGAIYQVSIGFDRKHSAYHCPGEEVNTEDITQLEPDTEDWDEPSSQSEDSYWDYYEEDYNYSNRDNPCTFSYYGDRRTVTRNVLASDLGIITKRGKDGGMMVAVTDLKTTDPLVNVDIEVFNFQNKLLESGVTDAQGWLSMSVKEKPFLLVAKSGAQRGYVKLNNGNSLSISNFDVHGQPIQKGIKGFIYTERGVWRPGDSIYVSFILEDKDQLLPKAHPVIFEFYNPRGQLADRIIQSMGVHGFYNFKTKTDQEDPTGNWNAKVKVGGTTFTKSLKVETIKPNRLKINLDFGTEKITSANSSLNTELEVKWLHGAIAKNLKAEFDVTLAQASTKFPRYSEFRFDDPVRTFYGENKSIFNGRLDENGKAIISTSLRAKRQSPGRLVAHFNGKVFEESGNFSIDRFSIPFFPYDSFVGVKLPKGDAARGMLLTDTTHTVDVVTVDGDGNGISRSEIEMEIYKLQWRWWWNKTDEDLSYYIGRSSVKPIKRGVTNTGNDGKGKWNFRIDYPEWGRYLVRSCDPESGHCTGKIIYVDWPGWAGKGQKEMPGGASMLSVSSNKLKYEVGEKVKLTIPGSGQGRALVSIENGSKVVASYWVETQKGQTEFSFDVTNEMAPNVYANVTLIQPHSQTVNDLPIRLYGIIPIMVDDPNTHLKPELKMADILAPNKEVKLEVSEAASKAMTYTIAIVDEGLLDLTRFRTPDAWSNFYAREALGVKTWDVYSDVMGAFGGKLDRLLAIGGGDGEEQSKNTKANRFEPVVIYMGPYNLEKGEINSHTFRMPNYIGSVKTMIVAGRDAAYGRTSKATPVRQSLMVLGTLPRVLGPEEELDLPVNVFVNDPAIKNVTVNVTASDNIQIIGGNNKTLAFNDPSDKVSNFRLKVGSNLGIGTMHIEAESGSNKATYDIEIDIRNPNPPVTNVIDAVVEAGKTWNTDYKLIGMAGTNSGLIEVTNMPPVNLDKRLKYLIRYPHGCIEQTTSSVFPQLYLSGIMELNDDQKQKIEENIKAGIERIKTFQTNSGGFAYWPGNRDANEWGSNYAGHFLLEAKKKGYNIPNSVLNKWKRYQKRQARNWKKPKTSTHYNDLIQAYRLYALALNNSPETGAMNRMRELSDLSTQAKWRLAAAYLLSGQKIAAQNLIEKSSVEIKNYNELSYTYGSTNRDKAMILETISLMDERTKGVEIVKSLSQALSADKWMSTQTTAYSLIAIAKFAKLTGSGNDLKYSWTHNGGSSESASTQLQMVQSKLNVEEKQNGKLSLTNEGNELLYVRLILEGTPLRGDQTSAENNLKMKIIYKSKSGQVIDPSSIEQGNDFIAQVTITNPGLRGNYKEMALTQIFPSGWEIHNTRLNNTLGNIKNSKFSYQDIRDDRVYTYFDLKAHEKKTFTVLLNATYAGSYYLPTLYCEAMYDNSINARKPGKIVNVVREDIN